MMGLIDGAQHIAGGVLAQDSHLPVVVPQEERPSLTPNHSVPEAAPARCVMTREGRKLYHVRNPFTPFEAMPTNISLRRHFLELNDGCPAPEDCSLCLKGHKDLVLPDLHKLATCLGHVAASMSDGPQIKIP